jgi:hypothetical protein
VPRREGTGRISLQGCLAASLALNTAGHAAAGLVATASGGENMEHNMAAQHGTGRGAGLLVPAVCRHPVLYTYLLSISVGSSMQPVLQA